MGHDVPMEFQTQKVTLEYIKSKYPHVTKVEYFTDGCAAQYKNCKSFVYLCYYEEDFHLKARWNFLATSHGKSPCDGIGETVKRLVFKASLQRPVQDQITTPTAMYSYCENNIKGITFFFIAKSDLVSVRSELSKLFTIAATVPGTRSMHCFELVGRLTSSGKRASTDPPILVRTSTTEPALEIPALHSYVACAYNDKWYIGLITNNHVEGDAKVKFLHRHTTGHTVIRVMCHLHTFSVRLNLPLQQEGRTN